ncbi:MAG: ISAs1 family transposase [Chloroflexota bacterium]
MPPCPSLIECIATLPDPRKARGKRHPLGAMVVLAVAATLCGARSYTAMAEWGRLHGAVLSRALGFTREQTPCTATFFQLFRRLDRVALDACLGHWQAQVLAALPAEAGPVVQGMAIDGKTLRGSRKQGAPLTHLLSAVSHRLGLTLGQVAVAEKTNEITAIHTLLAGLLLEGWVVTMDALLTQQKIAQAIVDAGGDYIMMVKENQPTLHADIATAFADPGLLAGTSTTATTHARGHGRAERRDLTLTSALAAYLTWPGQRQVFALTRTRTTLRTGEVSGEIAYGITSLSATRADAAFLLDRVRDHWMIENGSHYVRDVTFAEDHSQVRTGAIPQVMATCRTTAIAILRVSGEGNIAAACRRLAAYPWQALALLGIPGPTIK